MSLLSVTLSVATTPLKSSSMSSRASGVVPSTTENTVGDENKIEGGVLSRQDMVTYQYDFPGFVSRFYLVGTVLRNGQGFPVTVGITRTKVVDV